MTQLDLTDQPGWLWWQRTSPCPSPVALEHGSSMVVTSEDGTVADSGCSDLYGPGSGQSWDSYRAT